MPGRPGAAIATLIALSWLCCFAISQAKAGQFVKVSDDLELFYEDVGQGPPIVLVPGWTASGVVFSHQIDHFSKSYRVITYDPRSQGLSTRTLDHNDYAQHGRDLAALVCIDMPPRGMSTDPSDWATLFRARPGITARSCWLGYGGDPESYPSGLRSGSQIEAPDGAQSQFGYSRTGP